jgi:fluoroquinolone transport system ATP-binding protein
MLEVRNLSFQYRGASEATLTDLSFRVPRGTVLGFLGPSGAGKSTTQKILFGLLSGYQGSVVVLDRELGEWSRELYRRIGVFLEFPYFYGRLSAADNLAYYRHFYDAGDNRAAELLDRLGLSKDLNRRVEQFSKGMKMRLNLVRAMQHDPDLLFLDEPTSGLDPIHAARVKQVIRQEAEAGRTVFLTTHNMALAQDVCDEVAFLVDGRIRLVENPDELRRRYRRNTVRVEWQDGDSIAAAEFPLAGIGKNADYLSLIRSVEPLRIVSVEPDLEEIFLQTTGRILG